MTLLRVFSAGSVADGYGCIEGRLGLRLKTDERYRFGRSVKIRPRVLLVVEKLIHEDTARTEVSMSRVVARIEWKAQLDLSPMLELG